ncbi:winged helix-turn-helix domain-containing protein [Halorussus aquaticus]|uniref:Helix-turn-helix domain-containing protein n=1 Tax=Halorussus aquaticus TaxID=2953748 RepID=A0ABD5Q077_9EURY|nr:winged helix-turn-helix domain-containing protein [Halorussus aquaticus]
MAEEGTPEAVLELLDGYTCAILSAASSRPVSAKSIREAFGVPDSTLYRRLPRLVERGLLTERTRIDDDGNHYRVYESRIERVVFEVADGTATARVSTADDDRTRVETWRFD